MKKTKRERRRVIGFKVDPELKAQIAKLAQEQDRSQSWVIRQLLIRALEQQEKTA